MSVPDNLKKVFIVIPAYNEKAVIRNVLENFRSTGYHVVVIDDGSDEPLNGLLNNLPVYLLRHRVNMGQGAALQTGIEFALSKNADFIITFDADGQHQATDIPALLQPLLEDKADITLGSRFLEGAAHNMPSARKWTLQLARCLNFLFTGLFLSDAHNGLRAMNSKAAQAIHIRENGMAHATELLAQVKKKKLRYAEVPVNIHYSTYSRQKGQSIWSGFRIVFDILLNKIFK